MAVDLLDYIRKHAVQLTGASKPKNFDDLIEIDWGNGPQSNGNTLSTEKKVLMTMTALGNLISANPGEKIFFFRSFLTYSDFRGSVCQ